MTVYIIFAGFNSSRTQSVSDNFTYQYVYNIMFTSLEVDSIIINWPRAYVSIFFKVMAVTPMYVRAGSRERDGLQSYHK